MAVGEGAWTPLVQAAARDTATGWWTVRTIA